MKEVRRRLIVKMIFRFFGEIPEISGRFMVMVEGKQRKDC